MTSLISTFDIYHNSDDQNKLQQTIFNRTPLFRTPMGHKQVSTLTGCPHSRPSVYLYYKGGWIRGGYTCIYQCSTTVYLYTHTWNIYQGLLIQAQSQFKYLRGDDIGDTTIKQTNCFRRSTVWNSLITTHSL